MKNIESQIFSCDFEMICKKDVIQWFKDLESYKRIDTMCSLLLVCLPFELRFLGTFLEELGRRDSQRLRGMELRVNNPQDLEADMGVCQIGEPTDKKIRRRMALYLALLRVCNKKCVAEIFKTLESWGERDFTSMNDGDTLHELLLVYTMAANHPVFSFDQHMKCTAVLQKIKENRLIKRQEQIRLNRENIYQQTNVYDASSDPRAQMMPTTVSQSEFLPTHTFHSLHSSSQQHSQLVHILPQGTVPVTFPHHFQKIIAHDGSIQHQIPVEGIQHILSPNISIPTDSTIMGHSNAGWSIRSYPGGGMEHTPKSSSPMLSQQSSPSSSRAASPNRNNSCIVQQQTQQCVQSSQPNRNMYPRISGSAAVKCPRRSSDDTTPPSLGSQHQQLIQSDVMSSQNTKHIDDVILQGQGDAANNQIQGFVRNGYCRVTNPPRIKSTTYIPPAVPLQQSPGSQHFQPMPSGGTYSGVTYNMQNLTITDLPPNTSSSNIDIGLLPMNSSKSTGSDSASSNGSIEEISPPDTPTLVGGQTTLHMSNEQQGPIQHFTKQNKSSSRLNGRTENTQQCNSNINNNLSVAGGNAIGGSLLQPLIAPNSNNNSNVNIHAPNSNSNISNIAPLITSPNIVSATSTILGANIITSNAGPVLLQSQPYQPNFNFQGACQHVSTQGGTVSRAPPSILTANQTMASAGTPANFRLPNAFQMTHNVEPLIYPAYHPASLFLSGAPQNPQIAIRNSAPNNSVGSNSIPIPLQIPIQQPPPQTAINHQNAPSSSMLASATTYTPLSATLLNKSFSCYNCGSPLHNGRDCSELSMEDATRSAVYKLDFSVSGTSNVISSTAGPLIGNIQSPSEKPSHHAKEIHTPNLNQPTTSTIGLQTKVTAPPSITPKLGIQK